jgi:dTDP-4-amino-4,6-dideoxygalactose transaminase
MVRSRPAEAAPADQQLIGVFGSATGHEELEALTASVLGGWMGMGPRVREFEAAFAERLGVDFAMADSGSNALHLALAALELRPSAEVIVPSFTWVACSHAVVLAGHVPVFADVDLATANVDASAVERAVTERTAAIMVVHYAGKPADIDALAGFGLPLVEDAAHAVDSSLDGRPCGTLGDVGVFSFDSVKNLATPDGGGVASRRAALVERVRHLRYCGAGGSGFDRSRRGGRWWEHDRVDVFPRAIPNDVSASIALAQLRKLPEHQARRGEIWRAYQEAFADVGWLELPPEASSRERHSYFTFLVRVLDGRRDALAQHLLSRGIYSTLRYQPLHLVLGEARDPHLPNAETLNEQGLNLPLHPRLTDEQVDRVIDGVRSLP